MVLIVPDFSHAQISSFVSGVYKAFARDAANNENRRSREHEDEEEEGIFIPQEIATTFGIGKSAYKTIYQINSLCCY